MEERIDKTPCAVHEIDPALRTNELQLQQTVLNERRRQSIRSDSIYKELKEVFQTVRNQGSGYPRRVSSDHTEQEGSLWGWWQVMFQHQSVSDIGVLALS